ncbi:MAG: alpha/beta fold hydrolase [Gemmataceae bacterium]
MIWDMISRKLLRPTVHPVDSYGSLHEVVQYRHGNLELWGKAHPSSSRSQETLIVLKFLGVSVRAEKDSGYPFGTWSATGGESWAVNMPGYGQSSGPARLSKFGDAALAAFDWIKERHPHHAVIVSGGSLGSVPALWVASQRSINGLILRNPVDVKQIISMKYMRGLSYLPAAVARLSVPNWMDTTANARRVKVPLVAVSSKLDAVVPYSTQLPILNAFAGEKKILVLEKAGHSAVMRAAEKSLHTDHLNWLCQQVLST